MSLRTHFKNEKPLNKLADDFDWWMKNTRGHNSSDAEELLDWLYMNKGSEHIKDYNHFCVLAKEIAKKGYKTDTVIPEANFNKSIDKAKQREIDRKLYEELKYEDIANPNPRRNF